MLLLGLCHSGQPHNPPPCTCAPAKENPLKNWKRLGTVSQDHKSHQINDGMNKNNGSYTEVNIIGEDKYCIERNVGYPGKTWKENGQQLTF